MCLEPQFGAAAILGAERCLLWVMVGTRKMNCLCGISCVGTVYIVGNNRDSQIGLNTFGTSNEEQHSRSSQPETLQRKIRKTLSHRVSKWHQRNDHKKPKGQRSSSATAQKQPNNDRNNTQRNKMIFKTGHPRGVEYCLPGRSGNSDCGSRCVAGKRHKPHHSQQPTPSCGR